MKQLHRFLGIFICVQFGACCGGVIRKYFDFVNHPEKYAFDSAPWYAGIALTLVFNVITILVAVVARFIVGRVISKRERNEAK